MLFNSWQFLVFFPLVTALYFATPQRARWLLLLVASCGFYMAFIPAYILILALTIAVDYAAGLQIAHSVGGRRKAWLLASLFANLAILGLFKYFNFLNSNLAGLAGLMHWNYPIQALALALPIGLSFHVFQSLAYTIEVYRGNQAPERHLGIYALYVMFYPQLVAGPIERPRHLLPQFHAQHAFDARRVTDGLLRMAWGLFKKVVIADRLAALIAPVFAEPGLYHGLPLIVAVVGFSFQIYCDFSGYCDIALGAAEVMGFRLIENFNRPYAARSIREFWTRWHISLSSWFKDYVYLPLGGNRVPFWRWNLNLLVVFLLSGLWHGASWTFVVWGGLHGGYLIAGNLTRAARARLAARFGVERFPRWLATYQVALTFTLVSLAWIFFRASSLAAAWYMVTHLLAGLATQLQSGAAIAAALRPLDPGQSQLPIAIAAIALMELVQALQVRGSLRCRLAERPAWQRWSVYYALAFGLLVLGVFDTQSFIYFQF